MRNAHDAPRAERSFDAAAHMFNRLMHPHQGQASSRGYPSLLLGALAAITALAIHWQQSVLGTACSPPPVSIIRLEVTFSAAQFAQLLRAEGAACMPRVIGTLWPDCAFAVAYALLLAGLVLWADRWRRYTDEGAPRSAAAERAGSGFAHIAIAAGLLDVVENLCLLVAARAVERGTLPTVSVAIGSAASFLKWALLLMWCWGFGRAVFSGPRREIMRLLRFSALAVVVCVLPLLVIPQGQDLLQRLVEGAHPFVRISAAIVALAFAALAVWYCGRKVLDVIPRVAWQQGEDGAWDRFFADQLPRMLGLAVLVIGGAAFAREGGEPALYFAAAVGAAITILIVRIRLQDAALGSAWSEDWLARLAIPGLALLFATLVAAVIALNPGDIPDWIGGRASQTEVELMILRLAGALCLAVTCWFYLFVYFRRTAFRLASTPSAGDAGVLRTARFRDAHPVLYRWLGAGALASAILCAELTVMPVSHVRFIGAIWILAIFTANIVFLGSIAVWFGERRGIPVVRLALGLAVLCSLWNDNHQVRLLDSASPPVRAGATERLSRWLAAGDTVKRPVILVAASGGGLRAAYWSAIALASIQDDNPSFANHVFAMSGVSGGSLGIALFAALNADAQRAGGDNPDWCITAGGRRSLATCVRRFMDDDFLSPVLAKMVAPDLLQRFLPYPFKALDRSTALERSWEDSYEHLTTRGTFGGSLLGISRRTVTGAVLPALLLNSTHVETGRRYIVSSITLDSAVRDAQDVYGVLGHDIPLSVAVHNSARFTYVSPAGHLDRSDGAELGRVVDGGYFENSGLVTLGELIATVRNGAYGKRVEPVVLYLCNDPLACPHDAQADTATRTMATLVNELMSPVRAVLHARDARGSLARVQLKIATLFLQLNVCDSLSAPRRPTKDSVKAEVVERTRDRVVSPPLGWNLSRIVRTWMDSSLAIGHAPDTVTCQGHNALVLARLRELLHSDSLASPAPATIALSSTRWRSR